MGYRRRARSPLLPTGTLITANDPMEASYALSVVAGPAVVGTAAQRQPPVRDRYTETTS